MKAFSISREQLVGIIGALLAEEVRRRENRRVDFLTAAAWNAETPLDSRGVGLRPGDGPRCAEVVAAFFGCPEPPPGTVAGAVIGDWADALHAAITASLRTIAFRPAGRKEADAVAVHPADRIFADAAAAANLFHGRRRLVSFVAPHSLLGFVLTVLTPNLQRIERVDARAFAPAVLQETLQFGDVLVATPTLWRYIMHEGVTAPDNAMGVSFGEPMTPELATDLRHAGFGAQREIYGSTEDGLIGWRDSPSEPFILFDHWVREGERLARTDERDAPLTILPMDNLDWSGERRFSLSGRRDGAIQIGAVNVFPDKIEETLKSHALVEDCAVRISRHRGGVNRLVAHIRLARATPPTERTARAIDRYCRTALPPQERPSIFHFEETIPPARPRGRPAN